VRVPRSATASRLHGRCGYVLVVVLIVIVVLSLVAYRFTDAMSAEAEVAHRSREAAQARAHAVSGIHYAAGMLADANTLNGTLGGNPFDAPAAFSGVALVTDRDPRGGGRFSIVSVGDTFTGSGESRYSVRYGVIDEGGKLNINALIQLDDTGEKLRDALMKLPDMTEDVADAVVDWVDPDDDQRASGAESGYYSGLANPYLCKNGPLSSLEELLLVRGVTPRLLFGTDRNRNGVLDAGEDDGSGFSRGWSDFLTIYGREVDVDSNGNPRINVNDDEDVTGTNAKLAARLGQDMADYLTYYRFGGKTKKVGSTGTGGKPPVVAGADQLRAAVEAKVATSPVPSKFVKSVFSFVNTQITLPRPPTAKPDDPDTVALCPLNDPARLKELMPKLLEYTSTRTDFEMTPRVNVNTAAPEVLAGIPGLTDADVQAIQSARTNLSPTDPATTTGAWLVTAANLKIETFKSIEKYVTGRTQVYRVHSVGYFAKGGPVARVEAVVDVNQGHPRIVYFRDLTDLGRGFELAR
jgi:type II secretory pathway component PulK